MENNEEAEEVTVDLNDLGLTNIEFQEYKTENAELAETLKQIDEEDYEEYLIEFLEESDDIVLNETLDYIDKEIEDNEQIIFDDELIDEYIIDEDNSIIITPTDIYVDSFDESEEFDVTDPEEIKEFEQATGDTKSENKLAVFFRQLSLSPTTVNASSKTKKKTATHSRTYYAKALGQKVITVGIGAEFTYNGKKVTARTTEKYTKTHWGSLGTWQLKDKKNAVQKPSSTRRIVYQEATFAQGITVKGNGLVLQTRYLRANVESDQNGKIKKSSVSK
jgi:hypothetical protein